MTRQEPQLLLFFITLGYAILNLLLNDVSWLTVLSAFIAGASLSGYFYEKYHSVI